MTFVNPAAIASIPSGARTPIRYPRAIWDDRLRRKVSDAEIADGLECAA